MLVAKDIGVRRNKFYKKVEGTLSSCVFLEFIVDLNAVRTIQFDGERSAELTAIEIKLKSVRSHATAMASPGRHRERAFAA